MEIDYVVDKQGNKFKIKTSVDYGAVLTTSIMPEFRPVDCVCIAPNGLIFTKWRDPEYRGNSVLDDNRTLALAGAIKNDLFLPDVDKLFGYIHPDNLAAAKWVSSRSAYMDGQETVDGVTYHKYVAPLDVILSAAERIKANVQRRI
jgi:hypothetical protein